MSERKIRHCLAAYMYDGTPIITDGDYGLPAVLLWKTDYDAMVKELAEYKALIKVCDRCEKKDFHEFVRCGSLGLDYCESCFDEMGEK